MTIYEKIHNASKEELIDILSNLDGDYALWDIWFDKNYCNSGKCSPIIDKVMYNNVERIAEFSWCELHDGICKFTGTSSCDTKTVIALWLDSEYTDDKENN